MAFRSQICYNAFQHSSRRAQLELQRERTLLSTAEKKVLRTFREYQVTPGQMLCFSGPNFDQCEAALELMSDKQLLVKEQFRGGYSLTQAGFSAVRDYE